VGAALDEQVADRDPVAPSAAGLAACPAHRRPAVDRVAHGDVGAAVEEPAHDFEAARDHGEVKPGQPVRRPVDTCAEREQALHRLDTTVVGRERERFVEHLLPVVPGRRRRRPADVSEVRPRGERLRPQLALRVEPLAKLVEAAGRRRDIERVRPEGAPCEEVGGLR
jgi:hypothetical protein